MALYKFCHSIIVSHTRAVVRKYFKGNEASQWKRKNSTPRHTKTPKPIFTKIDMRK